MTCVDAIMMSGVVCVVVNVVESCRKACESSVVGTTLAQLERRTRTDTAGRQV